MMPPSDAVIFFTSLGLLVFLIWLLAQISVAANSDNPDDAYDADSKQASTNDPQRQTEADAIVGLRNELYAYRHARRYEDRQRSKREKNTIVVLGITAIFAFFAAIAAGISAWIFQGQLTEMRAERRAWLSAPLMQLNEPIEGEQQKSVGLKIENVGNAPALNTRWYLVPHSIDYVPNGTDKEIVVPVNDTCDQLVIDQSKGVAIFPSPSMTNFFIPYYFATTTENASIFRSAAARSKSLIIQGCLIYRFPGSDRDERHITSFTFFLRDVPGPSCGIAPNGTTACNWRFNLEPAGNDAN